MGVFINEGTQIAGWFVRENPTKMDENWGTPMTQETPESSDVCFCYVSDFSLYFETSKSLSGSPWKHRFCMTFLAEGPCGHEIVKLGVAKVQFHHSLGYLYL